MTSPNRNKPKSPNGNNNGRAENALTVLAQQAGNMFPQGINARTLETLRRVSKRTRSAVNASKLKNVQNRKNRAARLIARARYLKTLPPDNLTRNNLELMQYVNQMTHSNRARAYSKGIHYEGLAPAPGTRRFPSYQASRSFIGNIRGSMWNISPLYYLNPNGSFRNLRKNPMTINEPRSLTFITKDPRYSYYKSSGRRPPSYYKNNKVKFAYTRPRNENNENTREWLRNRAGTVISRVLGKTYKRLKSLGKWPPKKPNNGTGKRNKRNNESNENYERYLKKGKWAA